MRRDGILDRAMESRAPTAVDPSVAATGRVLDGFEVGARLDSGGFGDVYLARQLSLDRDAVIKILRAPDHRGQVARFEREARLASQLDHPFAAHVYGFGAEPDGLLWIAMELVRGPTLRDWIKTQGPLSIDRFVPLFERVCEVVHAAHSAGIVHRDIKPSNVMVIERSGRLLPKLLDFGIARTVVPDGATAATVCEMGHPRPLGEDATVTGATATGAAATVTATGDNAQSIAGTPAFMAPEQWTAPEVDHRADVYALGGLAYYCLTGHPPFHAETWLGYMDAHQNHPIPSLGDRFPEVLDHVVARALAKDPAERPGSALELADAIKAAIGHRPHRRRWLIASAAAAAALAIGIATVVARGTSPASCDLDPSLFAGRWDPVQRAALRGHLLGIGSSPNPEQVDRILAALDDQRRAIEHGIDTTCAANHDGALSDVEAATRTSCYTRRAYALGSYVASTLRPQRRLADVELRSSTAIVDCEEIVAPPLPVDRAPIIALWERFAAVGEQPAAVRGDLYQAIERDARQAGELELAALAAYRLAFELSTHNELGAADETLQRMYRLALEIHSRALQAAALVDRSNYAMNRGDSAAGASLANLARDIADHPNTVARARAVVYLALGRSSAATGKTRDAIEQLTKCVEFCRAAHLLLVEVWARELLINLRASDAAFERVAGGGDLRAFARDTVELARVATGEHSSEYAQALALLAGTAARRGGGVADRRHALAILQELYPPTHIEVVSTRLNIGHDLTDLGDYEGARRELADLLAQLGTDEKTRGLRGHARGFLALATWSAGHFDEALALFDQAIDDGDRTDPLTLQFRLMQLGDELELGRLSAAEHHVAAIEKRFQMQPDRFAVQLLLLRGTTRASLERAHHRPRQAEALTRTALASLSELHGDEIAAATLWEALGDDLLAQRRWREARPCYEKARALAVSARVIAPNIAQLDVELAEVDAGLGNREAARERALRAKDVLSHHPGFIGAGRDVAKLLATVDRGAKTSKRRSRPKKRSR